MSVWRSIEGTDPTVYHTDYGQDIDTEGWFDVAVSALGGSTRILLNSAEGCTAIALDPDGLAELHRRIVRARITMGKEAMWSKR